MNLWGFISAAVLLTLMPGPDILFVITQSITRGRKAGMVFAAGLCTGLIAHVTAVSLGVSILLMSSPVAFTMLKFAGAAYLLYLGVKAFLARRENHFELSGDAAVSGKLYRKGILMNILNPKVILFFLAFFPQLQQCIADICTISKPAVLNVVDAYRLMKTNGPRGKSEADVVLAKGLFMSPDIVAVDTAATKFFNQVEKMPLEVVGHLAKGEELKIGTMDINRLKVKRIKI